MAANKSTKSPNSARFSLPVVIMNIDPFQQSVFDSLSGQFQHVKMSKWQIDAA